jgi:hypothetical protein
LVPQESRFVQAPSRPSHGLCRNPRKPYDNGRHHCRERRPFTDRATALGEGVRRSGCGQRRVQVARAYRRGRQAHCDHHPRRLGPDTDIRSAYSLAGLTSGGRTVAIVDAYNDPTAGADLATYRTTYGLPACTTASGCFQKMDQRGGRSYPSTNGGRAQEISLDLDMVSATCPECHIPLVEAKSSSFANLGAAVNTAAKITGVTPPSTATAADMQPTPPTALTTTTRASP